MFQEEDYDNQTVTLKNPIDINDLRNNQEKGVVFELEEEEAPPGELYDILYENMPVTSRKHVSEMYTPLNPTLIV